MRITRIAAAFAALALMLGGCAVQLVAGYDPQTDAGLTKLYGDTSAFVDQMIAEAGTQAGTYAQNQAFYATADGEVDALTVRAEARQALGHCPAADVTKIVGKVAPQLPAGELTQLPEADCDVVLLKLIRTGFDQMAAFHKAQGDKGIPAVARGPLLEGGVGALLRAGIAVQIAKKAAAQTPAQGVLP